VSEQWWRDAVIYQVYPKSFADSNGDGMGDLPGITSRLGHIAHLGADAVWISPFYPSPQRDGGYDVADYCDIDPLFGTLEDFDALAVRAHELGLKLMVDLVPNHSSSDHRWFTAALASEPGSPERTRYIFREGRGADGELPPNDWTGAFSGPAWTRVREAHGRPGQWYLHLFDSTQPDLNWENPAVAESFDGILRFWLDRGVDGFRVDVAIGLFKAPGLPDWGGGQWMAGEGLGPDPRWDQDAVHGVYRRWRRLLDTYSPPRILAAESPLPDAARLALYTRPDEMHQAMNFPFLWAAPVAAQLGEVIERTLAAADGAPSTWVVSNHDVRRPVTRYGSADPSHNVALPLPTDAALGLDLADAVDALMLALPGSAYLYQGQELGLPDNDDIPPEARQDPAFVNSGGAVIGRDGCRVPIPWRPDGSSMGFGPEGGAAPWLPQPEGYRGLSVGAQEGLRGSTLELHRRLLAVRRERLLGRGVLTRHVASGGDVLAYVNTSPTGRTLVIANLGPSGVPSPAGARPLVATRPLEAFVPGHSTAWFALD
jgi:alpha-glucosidase